MTSGLFELLMENVVATQLTIFFATFFSLWFFEYWVLGETLAEKWYYFRANLTVALMALCVQTLFGGLMVYAATVNLDHQFGLLYLLPYHSSLWVSFAVMFILRDLLDYGYHLTMHRVPFLWRFHMVHHSDPHVDVTTTIREHFGETMIRNLFLVATTFLLGVGVWFLVIRQILQTVSNISSHSSVVLPPRLAWVLGWVFVTPNFHRMHHHYRMPHTNKNYGDSFSFWDRIFGSLSKLPGEKLVVGLDTTIRHSYNGWALMLMPFRVRPSRLAGYVPLPPPKASKRV